MYKLIIYKIQDKGIMILDPLIKDYEESLLQNIIIKNVDGGFSYGIA
ncbi:hypothetical protein [Clostridium sp. Marseille-QA1073]